MPFCTSKEVVLDKIWKEVKKRFWKKKNHKDIEKLITMFEYDIWMPYAFFVYTRLECVDEFLPLELHCVALFLAAGQWIGLDCGEPMVQIIEQHCKCGTIIGEILKCFFPMWVCCVVRCEDRKALQMNLLGSLTGAFATGGGASLSASSHCVLGVQGACPSSSCDSCLWHGAQSKLMYDEWVCGVCVKV